MSMGEAETFVRKFGSQVDNIIRRTGEKSFLCPFNDLPIKNRSNFYVRI